MKPKHVFFFDNGNTVVTDEVNQIPELQQGWFKLFVKFLEDKGVDVTQIEFNLPSGWKARLEQNPPDVEEKYRYFLIK